MAKFNVEIREILSRIIEVEAENEEKAMDKIREMYHEEDIVLDAEDFMPPAEIHILDENNNPITEWEKI